MVTRNEQVRFDTSVPTEEALGRLVVQRATEGRPCPRRIELTAAVWWQCVRRIGAKTSPGPHGEFFEMFTAAGRVFVTPDLQAARDDIAVFVEP